MKNLFSLIVFATIFYGCQSKKEQPVVYIDQNWIEVHFNRTMSTKDLVDIRERMAPLGVIVKYLAIQRDSNKNISFFQLEVQDGKGKLARSKTEFLDEIPYGIRIHRNDYSDEGFKLGYLYTKRPQ